MALRDSITQMVILQDGDLQGLGVDGGASQKTKNTNGTN